MAEHVHCLNMALQTMDYLRSGDRVCEMLDAAEETHRLHHEKFVSLYAELAKIKIHIQRHVFGSIRQVGANLSCWMGERGLRRQKRIGRRSRDRYCRICIAMEPMEDAPWMMPHGGSPTTSFFFGRRVPRSFVAVRTCVGINSASRDQEKQTPKQTHTTLGLSQGTAQGDETSCTLDLFFRCNCFLQLFELF